MPQKQDDASSLVSAIVSTYNSEDLIRGCIEDLEAQTIAERLEIVVVDSGSTQAERAIVEEMQRSHGNIVYLRTEERETIYAAWNRALAVATGRYVTNANTDDRRRRDALEALAAALDQRPEVALAYADCAITETPDQPFGRAAVVGHFKWPEPSADVLFRSPCFGPQPMWRRALHERYGLFDGDFQVAGDYEWWLRLSRTESFFHLPEVLGLYLLRPESAERRDPQNTSDEVDRARRRHWPADPGDLPPLRASHLVVEGGMLVQARERLIAEQEDWIEQLLESNRWLSEQLESWKAQAEELASRGGPTETTAGRRKFRPRRHL